MATVVSAVQSPLMVIDYDFWGLTHSYRLSPTGQAAETSTAALAPRHSAASMPGLRLCAAVMAQILTTAESRRETVKMAAAQGCCRERGSIAESPGITAIGKTDDLNTLLEADSSTSKGTAEAVQSAIRVCSVTVALHRGLCLSLQSTGKRSHEERGRAETSCSWIFLGL